MTKFTKGSTQDNYYYTVLPGARKGYISEILKKFRQLVETCKSSHLIDFLMGHLKLCSLLPLLRHMSTILYFIVKILLVNPKIHEILPHKIFQTQKWVNFTFPKTYPYMTLSNDTNNLAVPAVCKNFILMTPFPVPGNTVYRLGYIVKS